MLQGKYQCKWMLSCGSHTWPEEECWITRGSCVYTSCLPRIWKHLCACLTFYLKVVAAIRQTPMTAPSSKTSVYCAVERTCGHTSGHQSISVETVLLGHSSQINTSFPNEGNKMFVCSWWHNYRVSSSINRTLNPTPKLRLWFTNSMVYLGTSLVIFLLDACPSFFGLSDSTGTSLVSCVKVELSSE